MVSQADDMWELEQQIVETLISRLETTPSTITYGDLAKQIARTYEGREDARAWHYFDASLGRIQDSCVELGLPSLPVMVVKKHGMVPGVGYASHYRKSHPETAPMTDEEIGKMQWAAVRAFDGWQVLLDHYGINRKFTGPKDVKAEQAAKQSYEESKRVAEFIRAEVRRNRKAREACIEKKGSTCIICGFNSLKEYGVAGIIHAHHVRPVYEMVAGENAEIDPVEDLEPVCPNCHAFIHSKGDRECYAIEEAKAIVASRIEENHPEMTNSLHTTRFDDNASMYCR